MRSPPFKEYKKPGVSPVKEMIDGKNDELYWKEYRKNFD
jgi:hypothetical protein